MFFMIVFPATLGCRNVSSFLFFFLRLWIPISVSICGSGPPLRVWRSEDMMEMCNMAGEKCTRCRKGEI